MEPFCGDLSCFIVFLNPNVSVGVNNKLFETDGKQLNSQQIQKNQPPQPSPNAFCCQENEISAL